MPIVLEIILLCQLYILLTRPEWFHFSFYIYNLGMHAAWAVLLIPQHNTNKSSTETTSPQQKVFIISIWLVSLILTDWINGPDKRSKWSLAKCLYTRLPLYQLVGWMISKSRSCKDYSFSVHLFKLDHLIQFPTCIFYIKKLYYTTELTVN